MSKSNTDKKIDALTSAIERLIDSKPIVGQTGATGAAGAVGASGISTSPEDHNLILGLVGKMETVNVKVDALKDDIAELKKDKNEYVSQTDHSEVVRRLDKVEPIVTDLVSFKDTLSGKMWGIGVLAGFGTGILTLIAQYFLK